MRLVLLVLLLLGTLVSTGRKAAAPSYEAVLISKDMFECGDECVLVTEPAAVRELVDAVLDNETVLHACGHHWLLTFVAADGSIVEAAHHAECERYRDRDRAVHRLLEAHFERARRGDGQFLLDLRVPAAMTPEQAAAALADEGRVVAIDRGASRLPAVVLTATTRRPIPSERAQWDAAADANAEAATSLARAAAAIVVDALPAASAGEPLAMSSSFGGDEIADEAEIRVELPLGSDPSRLPPLPAGVKVARTDVPSDWPLLLVTRTRLDAAGRTALRSRHPFLLAVERHDEGCRPAR